VKLWQYQRLATPVRSSIEEADSFGTWAPAPNQPDRNHALRRLGRAALIAAIPFFFYQDAPVAAPSAPELVPQSISQPTRAPGRRPHLTRALFFQDVPPPAPPVLGDLSQPTRIQGRRAHLARAFFFQEAPLAAPTAPDYFDQAVSQPVRRPQGRAQLATAFFYQDAPAAPQVPIYFDQAISQPTRGAPGRRAHLLRAFFFKEAPDLIWIQDAIVQPGRRALPRAYLGRSFFFQDAPAAAPTVFQPLTAIVQPARRVLTRAHLARFFFFQEAGVPVFVPPPPPQYFEEAEIEFLLSEMGQDVTVGGVTVKGILDSTDLGLLAGEAIEIDARLTVFWIHTGSLPLSIGAPLLSDSITYRVREWLQVGDGALTQVFCANEL